MPIILAMGFYDDLDSWLEFEVTQYFDGLGRVFGWVYVNDALVVAHLELLTGLFVDVWGTQDGVTFLTGR